MAPLSRVQLAAALIEYDNDDPYADAPRYARDSAILASSEPTGARSVRPNRRSRASVYGDNKRDDDALDGGGRARSPPPQEMSVEASDRRSWITVREPHLAKERPASPPDFRRSTSPFLKDIADPSSSSSSARPDLASVVDRLEQTADDIEMLSPIALTPVGESARPGSGSAVPLSSSAGARPALAAPVPSRPKSVLLAGSSTATVPSGPSSSVDPAASAPLRPPSAQALKSYAPASPSPLGIVPLREPSTMARDASCTSLPPQPPSRPSSVPLEIQMRDQSTSLFAVPFFDAPLAPPPKRNKSPFRFLSPRTSPAASSALLPEELALRDAISALPRSLGGDPPSGDHRRGMGPRARTGSMGDWEDLVFQTHEDHGFKSSTPLSNFRSFASRSAAASQVFFDDAGVPGVGEGGLVGAAGGVVYAPDGTIVKKPRAKSMDVLALGRPDMSRPTSELSGSGSSLFEVPDFDKPSSALALDGKWPLSSSFTAPVAPALSATSSGSFSAVGDSPVVIPHPVLPSSPRRAAPNSESNLWETVARPPAELEGLSGGGARPSEDIRRRLSFASSTSAFVTSKFGKTPSTTARAPLEQEEHEEVVLDPPGAAASRSSSEVKVDRPRRTSMLGNLGLSVEGEPLDRDAESKTDEPGPRPESSLSLLDEIGRMTPGLLADADRGDAVDEVRRSLQQSHLSRNVDEAEVEYLAGDDVERERERWLAPPLRARTSRFDPGRPRSSFYGLTEEDRSEDEQPSDTRRRPGKPKSATARPTSLAHFKQSGRLATSATSSIYLPPVLVMPALLDPSAHEHEGSAQDRRGFFATAGKPLPADFKSRPPLNHSRSSSSFISSAAALAIPSKRLTLAQKTFRASLVVDGKRGNEFLGGALEEGARAFEEGDDDDENSEQWALRPEDEYRGPGTLYGRSLMDTLEQRKQEMASKKRTFRGDNRPAMFTRSTTEVNFASAPSFRGRPQSVHINPTFPADEGVPTRPAGMAQRGSVFGLDRHWQDAMAEREAEDRRLAAIERAREEAEEAAREAAEAKRIRKQRKGKKRMSSKSDLAEQVQESPLQEQPPQEPAQVDEFGVGTQDARASQLPPSLSLGDFQTSEAIEEIFSDQEEDSADERKANRLSPTEAAGGQAERRASRVVSRAGWKSSDDDEDAPKKKKRPTSNKSAQPSVPQILATRDDTSSSEDVPLAAHYNLPSLRSTARPSSFLYQPSGGAAEESSDEDVPLSQLKPSTLSPSVQSPVKPTSMPDNSNADDEDEDDVPLGVRHSTFCPQPPDEDDVPLGLSQAATIQQQYYLQQAAVAQQHAQQQMFMLQQQQQQQRMMMASMMGAGGGSMYGMPSAVNLQPPPSLPKDEKIARWRQDVAH